MKNNFEIERVVVNFADRCNMECPFCYIPFDGQRVDFSVLPQVLDHCQELGVKVITFGGGDPFHYPQFKDALKVANQKGFFVHVDTNALGIKPADLDAIKSFVHLIGLPLDGPTPEIVQRMRRSRRNNFEAVMGTIEALKGSGTKIKINTVASKINKDDLPALADFICRLPVGRWSLYQFWPTRIAPEIAEQYELSDADFDDLVSVIELRLKSNGSSVVFEPGRRSIRHKTYLFVKPNTNSTVYIGDPGNISQTLEIGSFLKDDWKPAFDTHLTSTLRGSIQDRYALQG